MTSTADKKYTNSPEVQEKQDRLMAKHNVNFSGYQVFCNSHYFGLIRRTYGDVKLCVVRFWSTTLMCDDLHREYQSRLLRPFFRPNVIKVIIPRTEFINGEVDNWEEQVAKFIKSDNKKTLIVMEGVREYYECKLHYERINRILAELEK
jgi:hypothetical protein